MKKPQPSVGDIIDARCTKCQKVTNHVVVAMVGIKPANVQCNTCQGTHRYRSPVPALKAARRTSEPSVAHHQEAWVELQVSKNGENAKDYTMDREFRVGTVIRHPSFGLGLVQRVAGNRKMEVLFETGKKIMRCK
jgi:hypothetical protein